MKSIIDILNLASDIIWSIALVVIICNNIRLINKVKYLEHDFKALSDSLDSLILYLKSR